MSYSRTPSRNPGTAPPTNQQSAWRSAAMHLKPYPKLQRSELRLESGQLDPQRGSLHVSQQGAMRRNEWGVRPARGNSTSGSLRSGGVAVSEGRWPLSVISTNTLRSGSQNVHTMNNSNVSQASHRLGHGEFLTAWARKAKISPSPPSSSPSSSPTRPVTFTSSLLFLSSTSPGSENQTSLSLYQTGGEDGEGPLDIWAVIKPGNTKEKIAIWSSGRTSCSSSSSSSEDVGGDKGVNSVPSGDSTPEAEDSGPGVVLSRSVSMKVKSWWEGECSVAKRRRRSGGSHHTHHPEQRPRVQEAQAPNTAKVRPGVVAPSHPARVPSSPPAEGEQNQDCRMVDGTEEEGKGISVGEIVAFMEQRACDQQQVDSKPVSMRSATTITLSKGVALDPPAAEEEAESVRVLDMVAKLESECLKRRGMGGGGGGDLSRNNSLRRSVGRVLLAGADACRVSDPTPPSSPYSSPSPSVAEPQSPGMLEESIDDGSTEGPVICTDKPRSQCTSLALSTAPLHSSTPISANVASQASIQDREAGLQSFEAVRQCLSLGQTESIRGGKALKELQLQESNSQFESTLQPQSQLELASINSPLRGEEEPLPGMLFFSQPSVLEPLPHTHTTDTQSSPLKLNTDSEPCTTLNSDLSLVAVHSHLLHRSPSPSQNSVKEEEAAVAREKDERESNASQDIAVPFPLRRMVSHEFLEMRFKIQLLLEPQQYLAFLPHHVIIKIFSLLPTQSLAALKITCHYFKFLIESYGVRPADSRWVCDPRYKDDPCKQCKRRFARGDVSLCRWHHKPYCQAMPYGPGYWMCCYGAHKDTPGCNVGLHDNRWVPAFHSGLSTCQSVREQGTLRRRPRLLDC